MTEDRELIKRTLSGERGAFDEIVARYQDGLYRHLLRLTGRREEAEDLCQEAFIGFYRSLRRFNPARPIAPFLFAIATNAWKMRRRRPDRETALPEEAVAGGDSVSEQVLSRLEHQQVLAAVAQLQPEQREAVSLFYDQGLSYREISGITGAPVGTVSTRLRRALETLRQALVAGGAGLVIPGVGDLPQYLTSTLQGQATAPGSIGPAVAHGISSLAPAGVGLIALWKEAGVMMKGIYLAIGLAVVGGAVVGAPRLINHHASATQSPGLVEVARGEEKTPAVVSGFSADRTMREDASIISLKYYVKGQKTRMEIAGSKSILIWRYDKNQHWVLKPADKTCRILDYGTKPRRRTDIFGIDDVIRIMGGPKAVTKELLGQEKANGYLCDKYSLTPKNENARIASALVWVAQKLSLVVRIAGKTDKETFQNDLRNVQVGNVPDSLFEVPEGYKKEYPPRPQSPNPPGK